MNDVSYQLFALVELVRAEVLAGRFDRASVDLWEARRFCLKGTDEDRAFLAAEVGAQLLALEEFLATSLNITYHQYDGNGFSLLCHEIAQMLGTLPPSRSAPPAKLELILYLLLPRTDCDALIGDLEQRYRKVNKRLGKRNADIWYTKQVVSSVWPLLRAAVRRVGGSAVVGVLGLVLRMVGLGSVADELKRLFRSDWKRAASRRHLE